MKKLLSLILSVYIIFSLSGCTKTDSTPLTTTQPTAQTENVQTQKEQVESIKIEDVVTPLYNDLKAYFIDVGQGDCAFIELPTGETMLIDAGNAGNGTDIVNFIKGKQYSDINYVVATHPHADHIGGMAEVLSSFEIGKMYMPKKAHNTKVYDELLDTIENENIALYTAKAGVNISTNGRVTIDLIAPVSDSYSNLNNYSAVVKITYGDTVFLFMGDAENEVEREILNNDVNVDADVLKVGHHGSHSSSSQSFISAVSPNAAVISAGSGNQYGHPHDETLALLNKADIDIYRTDEVGTICITADSHKKITVDKKASTVKENAPPVAVPSVQQQETTKSSGGSGDVIVYTTRTGECYHRGSCSSLSKSQFETTVAQAQADNYRPCKRCKPPQ